MEIAGLVLAVVLALGALVAYLWRRQAHGVVETRGALIRLQAASQDGGFVRGDGFFGKDGQAAMRDLKAAGSTVVDKKLSELVREIEDFYGTAQRAAVPPGQSTAWDYVGWQLEQQHPANEFRLRVTQALARASKLDRRRAGSY